MPGRDGTGPMGRGAIGGRGLGVYNGADVGGYGAGFGRGRDRGRGLVNGTLIKIEGGDYQLNRKNERMHGCGGCRRIRCERNFVE